MPLMQGVDANNIVRPLLVDANGNMLIGTGGSVNSPLYVANDNAHYLFVGGKDGGGSNHVLKMDNAGSTVVSALSTPYNGNQFVVGGYNSNLFPAIQSVQDFMQTGRVATSGQNDIAFTTLSGTQWFKITNILIEYTGTITNVHAYLIFNQASTDYYVWAQQTFVSGTYYSYPVEIWASASTAVSLRIVGATAGNTITFGVTALMMDHP
jgi:hypothetical protein